MFYTDQSNIHVFFSFSCGSVCYTTLQANYIYVRHEPHPSDDDDEYVQIAIKLSDPNDILLSIIGFPKCMECSMCIG